MMIFNKIGLIPLKFHTLFRARKTGIQRTFVLVIETLFWVAKIFTVQKFTAKISKNP